MINHWEGDFKSAVPSFINALCVKQWKLRRSKVTKSKDYFGAHFWTKTGESLFKWWKLPKFCYKYFSNGKWHVETLDSVLKKARKQQFSPSSPSLWIWSSKYTNIFQIFS